MAISVRSPIAKDLTDLTIIHVIHGLKKKKKEAKWSVDGMSIWIKLSGVIVDSGFYSPIHEHIPEGKPFQKKSQWTLHTFLTICLIVFVTVSYTFFVKYMCMEGESWEFITYVFNFLYFSKTYKNFNYYDIDCTFL